MKKIKTTKQRLDEAEELRLEILNFFYDVQELMGRCPRISEVAFKFKKAESTIRHHVAVLGVAGCLCNDPIKGWRTP